MNNGNSLPVSILATGNKWYSLKAYKGKYDKAVMVFFAPSNKPYHDILRAACSADLTSLDDIECAYNGLIKHSYNLFKKFIFVLNFHNFLAFIQQYKNELAAIGINTFMPSREIAAKNTLGFEVDASGIIVNPDMHHEPTHRQSLALRLSRSDISYTSKYFTDCVVNDIRDVNDSTWVVRTVDGHGPVMFFNLKDITNGVNNPKDIKMVKAYEVDRLKYTYKLITGIGYFNVRAVSFKSWKKFSLERKIGTHVVNVSDSIKNGIVENPILNKLINM